MFKRISLIVSLALAFTFITCTAFARTLVSYGDEQIYIGINGYPYSPETAARYVSARARQSLYLGDDKYCFTQSDSYAHQTLKIAVINHFGGRASTYTVAEVAFDPVYCQYDGAVYYVDESDTTRVMSFNPITERKTVAYRSSFEIDYLKESVNGLLIGEEGVISLYDARRKNLSDISYDPTDSEIRVFDDCHVEITSAGEMYVLRRGETSRSLVTRSAAAAWRMDDDIYYIQSFSTSARLSRYNLDSERSQSLYRVYDRLAASIVAVDGMVYMSNEDGDILCYDVSSSRLDTVSRTGAGYAHLELAAGNIVIYEGSQDGAYLDILKAEKPAPLYETVKRGSRGDVVARLQQKLRDLGYLTSSADGVFGSGTERAVRLLQFDMGYDDTGIASSAFQKEIIESGAPSYKQYVTLRYGSSGIRVEELNARLRELYYSKQSQLNEYDDDTVEAVERYQSQMGYRENGDSITASQQKALFRSSASECESYYTLTRGDSAPVVKRLNRRLHTLGYISSKHVSENYSSYTVKAIKKFQEMIYFEADGIADPDTQYELFSQYAPTPSPEPTPDPTPEPEPTPEPTVGPIEPEQAVKDSVINTMRTWMKNNLGGSYPRDYAVFTLQSRLVELNYMYEADINSVYDYVTLRAVMDFQNDNGLNANGNANKKTLAAMFLDY